VTRTGGGKSPSRGRGCWATTLGGTGLWPSWDDVAYEADFEYEWDVISGSTPIGELALIVPSATLSESRNAVINPSPPRAPEIKIARLREFSFDPR
jgi:hypothetical protein